jgi:hypothetical protein
VAKRRRLEQQELERRRDAAPGDAFDVWLGMLVTFVIEPVIDVFRALSLIARGKRPSFHPDARRPAQDRRHRDNRRRDRR